MWRSDPQRRSLIIGVLLSVLLVGFQAGALHAAEATGGAVDLSTAITAVAKENIPAVAHIEVTERQEVPNPLAPFENDPFFQYFFGQRKMPKKFQRELVGLGTGMIIDAQGHILTNNHVVGGATKIQVTLSDGRQYSEKTVKLIGTDPKTDLAIIQILSKEEFPFVKFGDSDKMEVGQWVVAIGHPRGLDQTVTQGIISAKHRRGISDPSSYQDFLQTDAAINPGNSGGPLLNLQGDVIGVNAAIMSESGGFEGIGFAIPINMADHIAKQLIATGKVERGWIGLSIQDLTPELASSFGLKNTKGALVADVTKGGPAEKAGIQRGDIIVSFEDKDVTDSAEFRNAVAAAPIGKSVPVTLIRGGKEQQVSVAIANQKEEAQAVAQTLKEKLGIGVRPLSPNEMNRFGLQAGQGLTVAAVEANGPLGKQGVEVGDILVQVNGQPVGDPDSLAAMLSAVKPNTKLLFLVVDHRSGQAGYIQVMVP